MFFLLCCNCTSLFRSGADLVTLNDMEEGVYKQFLSNRSISNVYFTFPISCLKSILEKLFRPVVLTRIELEL